MDERIEKIKARLTMSLACREMLDEWADEVPALIGRDPLLSTPYKNGKLPPCKYTYRSLGYARVS